jgi:hypothetical protein
MIKISFILPARGDVKGLLTMVESFEEMTSNQDEVEILCGIDEDDAVLFPIHKELARDHKMLRFMIFNSIDENFPRKYWNPLAREAKGRWIMIAGCDCVVLTKEWDKILYNEMSRRADIYGDDILHGLTRDNIKRHGEDPLYPNFSCNPVVSKEHVNAIGYFLDERYWGWGGDHAVTYVYKLLQDMMHKRRIISLTSIKIFAYNSMHTTDETNEDKLAEMRKNDKSYQKFLRISQAHPYTMTIEDAIIEAEKLKDYLRNKK